MVKNNNDPPSLLKSALKYALVLGWSVFPLKPKSKAPLTEHGFKDATVNDKQIRDWWQRCPEANIGLPTGQFVVLDVDPRNGGDESLEKLVAKHGPIPDTVQQITGGDGRHYLFVPNGDNRSGKLAPGLDIKGAGGYILAAPSIHPDTGKPYIWDGLDPLEKQVILPAPSWLKPQKKRTKPIKEKIREGQRNETLASMAGSMRYRGLSEAVIFDALLAINRNQCEPPLSEKEVRLSSRDICRRCRSSSCQSPDLVLPRPFPSVLTTMGITHRKSVATSAAQQQPL